MNATSIVLIWAFALMTTTASARELGGHECSDDCSGHAAGYRWAEENNITDETVCPLRGGGAMSFYEGCIVYVEDPSRGADEDDDGDDIDQ